MHPMLRLCFFLVVSLALSHISFAEDKKCYGLAFQGGGDKGAYEAGALSGLFKYAKDAQYDVVSGVAVGAINAAFLSQFPKGQEQDAADKLTDLWMNIKASDIYKNWPGGVAEGLLLKPSLYNVEPGVAFLKSHITKEPQRYISIGTTDIDSALYQQFHNFETNLTLDDFLQTVMASMALPGVFPYENINGTAYFDGSSIMSVDIDSLVTKCREITDGNDKNIVIDIVLVTAVDYSAIDASNYNGIKMLMRTLEFMAYNAAVTGLIQAEDSFEDVNFRYLIQPKKTLPDSLQPIKFDHKDIVKMINQGLEDAKEIVSKGEGVEFKQYVSRAKQLKEFGHSNHENESLMENFIAKLEGVLKENLIKNI